MTLATAVFLIELLNFFGRHQAWLTGPDGRVMTFADWNTCQVALIEKGYTMFNPLNVHGRCVQSLAANRR